MSTILADINLLSPLLVVELVLDSVDLVQMALQAAPLSKGLIALIALVRLHP